MSYSGNEGDKSSVTNWFGASLKSLVLLHGGHRSRDVSPFNGTGKEHGGFRRLGVLGNCLLTFPDTISLLEVPARAELALLLLIINNSGTV